MILFDVHAHLDFDDFHDDLDEVLEGCEAAGVKAVVANGIGPESNRHVIRLSREYGIVKPALGYYPVHVWEDGLGAVRAELDVMRREAPVALGEVGLDYKECGEDGDCHEDVQQEAFREFIRLAKELDVPIIVHSRKAEEDVLDILEEEGASKVVLHCFMGKKRLVERAAGLGYSFSVPVTVAKLEQLQWLVRHVPLKQLLTETDSPYLGPVRGERNDPRNVRIAVEKVAELKGMDPSEVANVLFMNYQRLFL
ncbi:MAG: TatD family hydrolase [Candidatus Woesearchaeota archaeon]